MTITDASSFVNAELRRFIEREIRDCQENIKYCESILHDEKMLEAERVTYDELRRGIEDTKQRLAIWNEKLNAL